MRPSRDEVLMKMAEAIAERSSCSRNHVGVVVALDGRVLVTGYNGAPAGMDHCNHDCICDQLTREGADPDKLRVDIHYRACPENAGNGCKISVHAEANAIAFAARHGARLEGAEMFTTLSPCVACAQLIINAGIIRVVHRIAYRDDAGLVLLRNAGIALA